MIKYAFIFAALWLAVAATEVDVLEKKVYLMIKTLDQLASDSWKNFDIDVNYKMWQAKGTKSEKAVQCTEEAAEEATKKIKAYVSDSSLTAIDNDLKQAYEVLKSGKNIDSNTLAEIRALVKNCVANFQKAITEYNMKFTTAGLDLAIAVNSCLKQ